MNREVIPESLHFETLNPNIEQDEIKAKVTSNRTEWPTVSTRPPLAGVNAFGLSGANAHVLVEGYRSASDGAAASDRTPLPMGDPNPVPVSLLEPNGDDSMSGAQFSERSTCLLPLSGKSAGALRDLAEQYLSWLPAEEGAASKEALRDMAWTAGVGRSHFAFRAGLPFSDVASLRKRLTALANSREIPESSEAPQIAFAYTGQAGGWRRIARELHETEPVARAILERCDRLLAEERGISMLAAIFGTGGAEADIDDPALSLPASYALQCALTSLWESVGVKPKVVLGHGPGRIAAAQAANVLTLEDGMRLATSYDQIEENLAGVDTSAPTLTLVDGATGQVTKPSETLDDSYFGRSTVEPFELQTWVDQLTDLGSGLVLEVSAKGAQFVFHGTSHSAADGSTAPGAAGFVEAVARAYDAGLPITFQGLFAGESRRRISLPIYPFQRRRHWVDPLKQPNTA